MKCLQNIQFKFDNDLMHVKPVTLPMNFDTVSNLADADADYIEEEPEEWEPTYEPIDTSEPYSAPRFNVPTRPVEPGPVRPIYLDGADIDDILRRT